MSIRSGRACARLLLLALVAMAGCAARRETTPAVFDVPTAPAAGSPSPAPAAPVVPFVPILPVGPPVPVSPSAAAVPHEAPNVTRVAFNEPANLALIQPVPPPPEPPLPEATLPETLDLATYTQEVLAANRSLQAMVAAWRAAAQKYPQAVAFDDPMFTAMTAPQSWSSDDVNAAYLLGGSQKIPWWGKRSLRGQVAQAEANAASFDVADTRLRLTQVAHLAFFEYYLVERQLELTTSNVKRLEEFRDTARRQYEAALVAQQDVLQAEVELAEIERRRIELRRAQRTAVARINTLVHRSPDFPLPPPPSKLSIAYVPAEPDLLRQVAVGQRPDLAALGAKIRGERAQLALAYKEFYPDFEVMGRYDRFWQPTDTFGDLQMQFGVNMNVPIYLQKRRAAAREAMFKLRQQCAEYEQRVDDIHQEVATAHAQVVEMYEIVRLYRERTLPAAKQNVDSANSEYVAGRGDFLRLISSQRQLLELQEKEQEAVVGYLSRLAELDRIVGGTLPMEPAQLSAPESEMR